MNNRRHDQKGRSTGRTRDRRAEEFDRPKGSWFWLSKEMIESTAWRVMSARALKMFMRVCYEHILHGGTENGRLKITFDDFVQAGVRRQDVRATEAELIALGFIERRFDGRRGWGATKGSPAEFRLCHLSVRAADNIEPPSNAWKRHATAEDAHHAVANALAAEKSMRKAVPMQNIDSSAVSALGNAVLLTSKGALQKCRNGTGTSAEMALGKIAPARRSAQTRNKLS